MKGHWKNRNRLCKWLSIRMAKRPRRMILTGIVLLNIVFFFVAACVISALAPSSLAEHGFWASAFYTVSMILDAGCITYVVEDVGQAGVAIIIVCLAVVLIGMVTFTGCVIGYITNAISSVIENSNNGSRRLYASGHTVILNWNSRASEIVNDLLYSENPEKVVVLVAEGKDRVEAEISNRLADTKANENRSLQEELDRMWARGAGRPECRRYAKKNRLIDRLTVIVRQGDTFSAKQLADISLDAAKTVIILNRDERDPVCRLVQTELADERERGNTTTIKTLVLVAEITGAENSADNQKIVVEVEDPWTHELVNKVIRHKENLGKCNIIAVPVDQILGQILSQFSIMPELNLVYSELFSHRGAEFFALSKDEAELHDLDAYFTDHFHAVPLTQMETKTGCYYYYMADKEADPERRTEHKDPGLVLHCNPKYWLPRRNVLILGHNSKVKSLMEGFEAFRGEWNPTPERRAFLGLDGRDVLNIAVVDDQKNLEKMDYYREYPYVKVPEPTEIYDESAIRRAINSFIDDEDGDTGILILSDDAVAAEDVDARALTYLIYVQEVLAERRAANGGKDTEQIDVVVEILNPKNYDVVHSYSVDNVVISNRYISKLITQIGDKQPLFEFYSDILTYDSAYSENYLSKELYVKRVREFLADVDDDWTCVCTAADLIRAVYHASLELSEEMGEDRTSIVLGTICGETGEMTIFSGNQTDLDLVLHPDDKLIMFSSH